MAGSGAGWLIGHINRFRNGNAASSFEFLRKELLVRLANIMQVRFFFVFYLHFETQIGQVLVYSGYYVLYSGYEIHTDQVSLMVV